MLLVNIKFFLNFFRFHIFIYSSQYIEKSWEAGGGGPGGMDISSPRSESWNNQGWPSEPQYRPGGLFFAQSLDCSALASCQL